MDMKFTKKYFKINFIVLFISFFLCTFLTISYAAIATTLNVTGQTLVKSPKNIRVSGISMTNSINGALDNYDPLFYLEEFVTSSRLPNLNSEITYTVLLKNTSNKNYMITDISPESFSNNDVEYIISGLNVGDVITSGTVDRPFTITYKYKTGVSIVTNPDINAMIDIDWQETYIMTYNTQGGSSCAPSTKRVTNTLTYGTLCTPTRPNYRFAGFYTGTKGTGTQIIESNIVSLSSDLTVYASWIYEQDLLVGNFPKLKSGMIPVTYNEATRVWQKADIHEAWYDYNLYNWANIVTTTATNRNTYLNAAVGTTIPMTDINTMFVWIPRYSYAIKSNFGEGGTSATNPGYIQVKFVNRSTDEIGNVFYATTPSAANWRTHPSFWWDNNNDNIKQSTEFQSGLWIGKFESTPSTACTAGTTVNAGCDILTRDPYIKPNLAAWRGIRQSTADTVINTNMNGATGNTKYGFPNDTTYSVHMMKNSEWGAVAYLTQSLYGKFGNPNYATVPLKEVYINNSSSYFSGRSGGRPGYAAGYSVANGCFDYDGYIRTNNVACNPTGNFSGTVGQYLTGTNLYLAYGASTTGTVYGIYDMSGGSEERMMSDYYGVTSPFNYSGTNATTNTGFNGLYGTGGTLTTGRAWPQFRFYDRYTTTTLNTSCGGSMCYGHAFSSEAASWYGDTNTTVLSTSLVSYLRGGLRSSGTAAGIFQSNRSAGNTATTVSFRVSMIIIE